MYVTSMLALVPTACYIFEPIAVETMGVFWTHQLATSWLILEGGSPSILARLVRPAIYFKGFLFWCMTLCWPLTAWT